MITAKAALFGISVPSAPAKASRARAAPSMRPVQAVAENDRSTMQMMSRRDAVAGAVAGVSVFLNAGRASAKTLTPSDPGYLKSIRDNAPPPPPPEVVEGVKEAPKGPAAKAVRKAAPKAAPAPKKAAPAPKAAPKTVRKAPVPQTPAPKATPKPKAAPKTTRKAIPTTTSDSKTGGQTGALLFSLAGVGAAAAALAASPSEKKEGGSKPKPASTQKTAEENAEDAQKWIDDWKAGEETTAAQPTAEENAADAQRWIDEWKANMGDDNAADAQSWINKWKQGLGLK